MIQFRKLLLAHSLHAVKHPDGREADGFYEVNSTGVFLRDKNDVPFAFVSYASWVIQTVEPCPSHPGRWRGLGFLTVHTAERIGIDLDSDDLGKIGHDFLVDIGMHGIPTRDGVSPYILLYTTLEVPPGSPPGVFQCDAASADEAIRKLYVEVPAALNVQHRQGRDLDRALARWEHPRGVAA